MTLHIKHDIVRLEISEHDASVMQFFDSQQYFSHIKSSLLLCEAALNVEVLRQITSWAIIKDKVQFVLCLKGVSHLDDEWMVDHTHDVFLCHRVSDQVVII